MRSDGLCSLVIANYVRILAMRVELGTRDGRVLRRYKRSRKVKHLCAWQQRFRCTLSRYEY